MKHKLKQKQNQRITRITESTLVVGADPDLLSRITIFNKEDKLIAHLGESSDHEKEGWPNLPKGSVAEGTFSSPHGLCVAPNGDIYVVEWVEYGRVTKLTKAAG